MIKTKFLIVVSNGMPRARNYTYDSTKKKKLFCENSEQSITLVRKIEELLHGDGFQCMHKLFSQSGKEWRTVNNQITFGKDQRW